MFRRWSVLAAVLLFAGLVFTAWHLDAAPARRDLSESRQTSVDIELILAVDISYSMDPDELALQREGYSRALTSAEFLNALKQGIHGKIAITYFEWAGVQDQKVVVPWRLIDGPESAGSVANEISQAPLRRAARTSISGALLFGMKLFESSGQRGIRRVIDISGDGANNSGPLVVVARDEVLSHGITINGLPVMLKRPSYSTMDIEQLDEYYEDCVIGGPAAFVVPVKDREKFVEAIRTKLVLEIASLSPDAKVTKASAANPRVPCTIGERIWQERWGN
ncbi:DUF1194 domain-containing protein [Pseudorhodoplanes sinuspersici]|uniref:Uncharacterized protein n=1 Tax=Pseudorhodoplanes sinuspersici TaxID=1235591 RepID=A0A1W6ZSR9_9HYPH|nr:hypothetical protein CAK95_15885 [Pseudorhodoplanes sinuspersici]RKE67442.1 uncharacterized protein DUF1194 [Pseudorhodoplanes sinuspersici]